MESIKYLMLAGLFAVCMYFSNIFQDEYSVNKMSLSKKRSKIIFCLVVISVFLLIASFVFVVSGNLNIAFYTTLTMTVLYGIAILVMKGNPDRRIIKK